MHARQFEINTRWETEELPAFGLGLGLSTGEAAAALLGSEERLEYTLVGDTVNLAQRLQQLAGAGETVLSGATLQALTAPLTTMPLPPQLVKGRDTPVIAYKIESPARMDEATALGAPIEPPASGGN
jgi:class 3 adenylate cyclase